MTMIQDRTEIATMADLWARLGGVPLERILSNPAPGTAVEDDVIRLHDRENRLFELVDGTLVEKPMGYLESTVAACLIHLLRAYVKQHQLGVVAATDGMMRLTGGLVRIPDVSVVLWARLPGRRIPSEPIPALAPDLAVEILSASNTAAEMDRKVKEYFTAGCQSVWLVDPVIRTIDVYSGEADFVRLSGEDEVRSEAVLPGFHMTVAEIFRESDLDH